MTAELAPSRAPIGEATAAPVFVAGPDRSGTTLMFALLASHPDLSMVRRTNMWRYFHDRYGDLGDPEHLDECLTAMTSYRRMRHLEPDEARIREEFARGPSSYGRLFALFHTHHAQRCGKSRWGDKSLHTEHYADRVFREFPAAAGGAHGSRSPRPVCVGEPTARSHPLSRRRRHRPLDVVDASRPSKSVTALRSGTPWSGTRTW